MEELSHSLIFLASFGVIALAAWQIGHLFMRVSLPLITGFLFTGLVAGPYVLSLIPMDAGEIVLILDEISLGFIAFAAGSELHISELRHQLKGISYITAGLVLVTLAGGASTVLLVADRIPFVQPLPLNGQIAVALLVGTIMVARSPSSAIAVINELRARGPFTQMALGVTVIMDVVVIVLFAVNSSVAHSLLGGHSFTPGLFGVLVLQLLLAVALAYVVAQLLRFILSRHIEGWLKIGLILAAGYGVFVVAGAVRTQSHTLLPFEIWMEPLLVCMVASFIVASHQAYRAEFAHYLHKVGPYVYVTFFTLTGASLALDVLAATWVIALLLFSVRLVSIFLGSLSGSVLAREPFRFSRLRWMAFVTQAGVSLGLAKEVEVEFPEWGASFATMIISLIVLNEMVGPIFFKWVVNHVGEARRRAPTPEFDGVQDALIFGLEGQSLALARLLLTHGWQVKVVCHSEQLAATAPNDDNEVPIAVIDELSVDALRSLETQQADAIVAMLSDEENYQLAEMIYEEFGTQNVIVRLTEHNNYARFERLGSVIIEPSTAMVSLLDHFVRSPAATSLLLGQDGNQDVIDIQMRNPEYHGRMLRELHLPLDVLVLSVRRNNNVLISHGYTELEMDDWITVLGTPESLDKVAFQFSV